MTNYKSEKTKAYKMSFNTLVLSITALLLKDPIILIFAISALIYTIYLYRKGD